LGPGAPEGILPDAALHRLHEKLRGARCETPVWDALLPRLSRPLPVPVALDLLARRVAFDSLGHSRQADEVQWRLARVYEEALLTLAKEYYAGAGRSVGEFRRLMEAFGRPDPAPGWEWVLESLALLRASSPEKAGLLLEGIAASPHHEELLRSVRVTEWEEAASGEGLGPAEAEELFGAGEPRVWRALARNPRTPESVLRRLTALRGVKLAAVIRDAASHTLRRGLRA
jgi:hypothetical protein